MFNNERAAIEKGERTMQLRNDKVMLVKYEPCHAPYLYMWANSGEYDEFFNGKYPTLYELQTMALPFLKNTWMIASASNPDQIYGVYVMTHIDEKNRNLEWHTMIDSKYQGNGVFKSSCVLMLYHILNEMNFYKVICKMREDNIKGEAAAKDVGFELEGVLRHQLYTHGEFKNIKRYYMMKGMFNRRYKQKIEEGVKILNTTEDNICAQEQGL